MTRGSAAADGHAASGEDATAGCARLDEQAWDQLFDFLDPDRPARVGTQRDGPAQARYAEILRKLACFFAGRGCCDADDLAVEAMLRVAGKSRDLQAVPVGDRLGYFFGVARNVHHEWLRQAARQTTLQEEFRREQRRVPPLGAQAREGREAIHRCLDRCLAKLTARARQLIVRYYSEERSAKILDHRRLAGEFGKSVNALRIEAHRVRHTLRLCVLACVQPGCTDWVAPARATNQPAADGPVETSGHVLPFEDEGEGDR